MAKDFGFDGVEMRGLGDEIFSVNAKPFCADNLPRTIETLRKKHLEICCLSSGCALRQTNDFIGSFSRSFSSFIYAPVNH